MKRKEQWHIGRLVLLAVMAAAFGGLAWERGGASVWFATCAAAGLVLFAALSLALPLRGIHVERELSATVLAHGGELEAMLELRGARSLLPVWMTVAEHWVRLRDGEEYRLTRTVNLGRKGRVQLLYRMTGLERGEYRFAGVEIAVGDVWGLGRRTRWLPLDGAFAVLPKTRLLTLGRMPSSRGGEGVADAVLRASHGEPGVMLRDYAPGDSMRTIHWRASARTGELRVRQPEPADERRLMVWLDAYAGAYSGRAGASLFEEAVSWAAGMLLAAQEAGRPVGLAVNGRAGQWLGPALGRAPELLRLLAAAAPDGGSRELALTPAAPAGGPIRVEAQARPPGGIVPYAGTGWGGGSGGAASGCTHVIVTPSLRREVLELVGQLREAGCPVAFTHVRVEGPVAFGDREPLRALERLTGSPVAIAAAAGAPIAASQTEARGRRRLLKEEGTAYVNTEGA